jgi:hypothetical protein
VLPNRRRPGRPRARARLGCLVLALASAAPAARASGAPGPAVGPPARPEAPVSTTAPSRGRDEGPTTARPARLDRDLAEIDALLDTAHFRTALARVESTRRRLGGAARPGPRGARLEVMAATAEVALGLRARARESMIRALRADPGLTLDAGEVSPKLRELLAEARRRSGIAEPTP